jgi:hypothetical protein
MRLTDLREVVSRAPHARFASISRARPSALRHLGALGAMILTLLVSLGACSDSFPTVRNDRRLVVELKDADKVTGSRLQPLALTINTPQSYKIVVRAVGPDGNVDAKMNGWVRVSSKPGAIERLIGADAEGRNLKLTNGESTEVEVRVVNAYGATYILADDLGYEPKDPLADPRPACANGVDDDGDGVIDFPADEGCAFANDDSETGGSYAQGASPPIYFQLPRIADVRGLVCANGKCSGSGKTAYPKEQVQLDTGYHDTPEGPAYDFDMIVTRIASDGFYVSDIKDTRGGFNSIFSFNFNAPPRMRVCDRLKSFAGTATEFFGFTQVSYPTWTLEEWDPTRRPCYVPEPRVLGPLDVPGARGTNGAIVVPPQLLPLTGSLVRALTSGGADGLTARVTPKFGPGNMPEESGVFVPAPDATNCDLNKDGTIDFTTGVPEQRCADACTRDPECTEYSNFASRSSFRITISDGTNAGAIQADATASAEFHPLEKKGQPIKSFTGTLHFFSGGSQYTIEARCKDDIVTDVNQQPLPSDKACVFPRTVAEENPQ